MRLSGEGAAGPAENKTPSKITAQAAERQNHAMGDPIPRQQVGNVPPIDGSHEASERSSIRRRVKVETPSPVLVGHRHLSADDRARIGRENDAGGDCTESAVIFAFTTNLPRQTAAGLYLGGNAGDNDRTGGDLRGESIGAAVGAKTALAGTVEGRRQRTKRVGQDALRSRKRH